MYKNILIMLKGTKWIAYTRKFELKIEIFGLLLGTNKKSIWVTNDFRKRKYWNETIRYLLGLLGAYSLKALKIIRKPGNTENAEQKFISLRWTKITAF